MHFCVFLANSYLCHQRIFARRECSVATRKFSTPTSDLSMADGGDLSDWVALKRRNRDSSSSAGFCVGPRALTCQGILQYSIFPLIDVVDGMVSLARSEFRAETTFGVHRRTDHGVLGMNRGFLGPKMTEHEESPQRAFVTRNRKESHHLVNDDLYTP